MPIYAVKFRREQYATVYVEAEDVQAAKMDAVELTYDEDWYTEEESIEDVYESRGHKGRYWSGGEQGDWVSA